MPTNSRQVRFRRPSADRAAHDRGGTSRRVNALGRTTAVLAGAMALAGAAGGVGLVGGGIDFGDFTTQIMDRIPWHSGVLAGSALLVTVTVPMSAVVAAALRRSRRQGILAVAAGLALVAWILVELAFIRTYSWMQPFCTVYGAVLAALGWCQHRAER